MKPNTQQSTLVSNWSRLAIAQRQTRKERREFPRQIPHVFADAATLPTRLVKGLRWVKTAAVVAILLIGMAACNGRASLSPVEPVIAQSIPVHTGEDLLRSHNVPAIDRDGRTVVWLCETKARPYRLPSGQTEWTFDHYIQSTSCPEVPID